MPWNRDTTFSTQSTVESSLTSLPPSRSFLFLLKDQPFKNMKRAFRLMIHEDPATRDQFAKTPEDLYKFLSDEWGPFDFDPCPVAPLFNGLEVDWRSNNYVNPPYDNLKAWLEKAIREWDNGSKQVVFLMPMRIHTNYFLDKVMPLVETGAVHVYVLRGGVKFQGYKHRAPFGVIYLVFPKTSSNSCQPDDPVPRHSTTGISQPIEPPRERSKSPN